MNIHYITGNTVRQLRIFCGWRRLIPLRLCKTHLIFLAQAVIILTQLWKTLQKGKQMLRTWKQIKYWFTGKNFPMDEIVANELYTAKTRLLEAEASLDWAISSVEYYKNRVARLEQNYAEANATQRAIEFNTEPKLK